MNKKNPNIWKEMAAWISKVSPVVTVGYGLTKQSQ